MNQKEQFESLMKVAEFNIGRFDKRREFSWKIALGFWGAILGSVAVVSQLEITYSNCGVWLVGLIVIYLHIGGLIGSELQTERIKPSHGSVEI